MLWINNGLVDHKGVSAFKDVAEQPNVLNPHRFGWGAAIGDIDRDGKLGDCPRIENLLRKKPFWPFFPFIIVE